MNEELRKKVMDLKNKVGISYKKMAENAGISYDSFKKFTSGARNLSKENEDKLTTYLRNI